jgi:glutaredoxin
MCWSLIKSVCLPFHRRISAVNFIPFPLAVRSFGRGQALTEDSADDGSAIQAALAEMTGQSSVPNIFIKQKHIGGNSDLQAKRAELPQLLRDAGAL